MTNAQIHNAKPADTARAGLLGMVRHLAWTGSGDLAAKLAMLLTTLLAARQLEPGAFGHYAALYAVSLFAASLWDLGVSSLLTREIATNRLSVRDALGQVATLRLKTAPLWLVVLAIGMLLVGKGGFPSATTIAAYAGASLVFGLNTIVLAGLRGSFRFRDASLAVAAGRWLGAACAFLLLTTTSALNGINALGIAFLAGELTTLLIAAAVWLRQAGGERSTSRLSLREALPFAANSILATAYNRLDVIAVAALASAQASGQYATASRLQDALYLLPATVGAVAFPTIAKAWSTQSTRQAGRVALGLAGAGLAVAVPVVVLLTLFMPRIVDLLLGEQYAGSIGPVRILVWFLPLAMVQAPILAALSATGHAVATTKVFATTLVVAMTLHLSLDWWAGAEGAAFASLTRDLVATPLSLVLALRCGLFDGLAHRPERPSGATHSRILGSEVE